MGSNCVQEINAAVLLVVGAVEESVLEDMVGMLAGVVDTVRADGVERERRWLNHRSVRMAQLQRLPEIVPTAGPGNVRYFGCWCEFVSLCGESGGRAVGLHGD